MLKNQRKDTYYEPATGRFISEDPAQDGVNWYLYADGNPVDKVDVDGNSARAELLMLNRRASQSAWCCTCWNFAFDCFLASIGNGR